MSKATSGSGTTRTGPTPNRPATPPSRGNRAPVKTADAARFQDFFSGLASEMRRVTWPTRQEWVSATILTVVLVAAVSLFTYAVDVIVGYLFGLVHH
jgi:preprotein translocase subunit SecE